MVKWEASECYMVVSGIKLDQMKKVLIPLMALFQTPKPLQKLRFHLVGSSMILFD